MHGQGKFAAKIVAQLANGFDERQRFDVTDRSANFAQNEIKALGIRLGEFLDSIRYMRDDLNRRAEIIPATFLLNDRLIDAPRRYVVGLPRGNARKAFIMSKVEVGFRPVIGHIDFAMLIRRHRARINIEIRIELPDSNAISARLQKGSKRCCHKTFAKRGDHATGDKNEPCHGRKGLRHVCRKTQANESVHRKITCVKNVFSCRIDYLSSGTSDAGAAEAGAAGAVVTGAVGAAGTSVRSRLLSISPVPPFCAATKAKEIERIINKVAKMVVIRVRKSAAPRADINPDGLPPIPKPPPSDRCIKITPTSEAATIA